MKPSSDYPVYAVPIPEPGNQIFLDFLDYCSTELGKVGGRTIDWVPIDNPKKIDTAHASIRSKERALLDDKKAKEFEEQSSKWGGPEHYIRIQYSELLSHPEISSIEKPAVIFAFRDVPGMWAVLTIPPEYLDSPANRRFLGRSLMSSLTEKRFLDLSDNGHFTFESVTSVQTFLESIKLDGPFPSEPSFPVPPGTKWEEISINFRDGHTVYIKAGKKSGRFNFTEMGMAHGRTSDPTKQWDLLRDLANGHGQLSWKSSAAHSRQKKQKGALSKRLREFFGIQEDPIYWDRAEKCFKCRFHISPE